MTSPFKTTPAAHPEGFRTTPSGGFASSSQGEKSQIQSKTNFSWGMPVPANFPVSNYPNLVAPIDDYRSFLVCDGGIFLINTKREGPTGYLKGEKATTPKFRFSSIPFPLTSFPRILRCNCNGTKIFLLGAFSANVFNYSLDSFCPTLEETTSLDDLFNPKESLIDVQFSPINPNYFVAAYSKGTIRVINVNTGKCEKQFCVGAPIRSIRFGQKGPQDKNSSKDDQEYNYPTLWSPHTLLILTERIPQNLNDIGEKKDLRNNLYETDSISNHMSITHIFKLCPFLLPGDEITTEMMDEYKHFFEKRANAEDYHRYTYEPLENIQKIGPIADVIVPPPVLLRPDINISQKDETSNFISAITSIAMDGQFLAVGVERMKQSKQPEYRIHLLHVDLFPVFYSSNDFMEDIHVLLPEKERKFDIYASWRPNLVNCPYLCNISKNGVERIWISSLLTNSKPSRVESQSVLHCNSLLGFASNIALIQPSQILETSPFQYGLTMIDLDLQLQKSEPVYEKTYDVIKAVQTDLFKKSNELQKEQTEVTRKETKYYQEAENYAHFLQMAKTNKPKYLELLAQAKDLKKQLLRLRSIVESSELEAKK